MLAATLGIVPQALRFRVAKGGKPELDPALGHPDLQFNLSHTRGMVSCAMGSGHALGVDVETCEAERPLAEMAERFFAPPEVALVRAARPDGLASVFYRLWTLKEAYIKATGRGLAEPLDRFAFSLDPVSIGFLAGDDAPQDWQFAEFEPGLRHRLALAVRRPAAEPMQLDAGAAVLRDCLELADRHRWGPAG